MTDVDAGKIAMYNSSEPMRCVLRANNYLRWLLQSLLPKVERN